MEPFEIPVIKSNKLTILNDGAFYGITEKERETEAVAAIQEFINDNVSLKADNPYDFRKGTAIDHKSWGLQQIGNHSINIYKNNDANDGNHLVSGDRTTGFEKVFWFKGVKA